MTHRIFYTYLLLALLNVTCAVPLVAAEAAVPAYEVVTLPAYIAQTLSTSY